MDGPPHGHIPFLAFMGRLQCVDINIRMETFMMSSFNILTLVTLVVRSACTGPLKILAIIREYIYRIYIYTCVSTVLALCILVRFLLLERAVLWIIVNLYLKKRPASVSVILPKLQVLFSEHMHRPY